MPFVKGQPRPAGAGRKKGVTRETVALILDEMGCDPIRGMATIAMDRHVKKELRLRAYAELARYRWPQLKAIEHSGPAGGPIEYRTSAREEFASRIASLAARIGTSRSISKPD